MCREDYIYYNNYYVLSSRHQNEKKNIINYGCNFDDMI